ATAESGEPDEPWPALAALQLWRIYERQERTAEAASWLHALLRRHPRTPTAPLPNLLTVAIGNEILRSQYELFRSSGMVVVQAPKSPRLLEQALDVTEYMRGSPERARYLQALLVQTCHAAGEREKARTLGQNLL